MSNFFVGQKEKAKQFATEWRSSVIYKTFDPPLAEGNTTGDDGFILVENWAY